jgi:hypothetical protein
MEVILGLIKLIGWAVIIISTIFTVIFVKLFFQNLKIQQELSSELSSVQNEFKQSMMVYIEKVQGTWHMYDAISNFFVAQGKDEKELWENAQLRCPDMNIILGNVTVENGNITVSTSKIEGDL